MNDSEATRPSAFEPKSSRAFAELRRRAERRLRHRSADAGAAHNEADTLRLLHELQVHQVELEIQNEELLQAREAREAALEKYGELFDFAPVGYVALDRDGSILEANFTVAGLLGVERSRLLQRHLSEFVDAADRTAFTDFLRQLPARPARTACDVALRKPDDSTVAVRIEATVAASGEELRVTMIDATERNRAEQARLLRGRLEATSILAGGIAHDFNNLLTVMFLDLDRARALAPTGELAGLLEETRHAASLARELTQQLVAVGRGGVPDRQPASLAEVVPAAVRAALSGSHVQSGVALADDLWLTEIDRDQIAQMVRHLVRNAREAMPDGGVIAITAENMVLAAANRPGLPVGDYVRMSIADPGGGIAASALEKIFDPYFSTKQRGSEKGVGLGLAICHAIVQQHAGAIEVQSRPGHGTTVHVLLPACSSGPGAIRAK